MSELVLCRLDKMERLRRMQGLLHDKRHEIPLAVARVDQQLYGDAVAERFGDLHELPGAALPQELRRVVQVERLPRHVYDKRQEIPVAGDRVVPRRHAVAERGLHDLPELVLRRLVKMGQLRRLPRLVHDQRQKIPFAVARVDQLV